MPDAQTLLARYPGPVHLRPSLRIWLTTFLISLAFVTAGIGMLRESASSWDTFMAWAVLLSFGACGTASTMMLLPGGGGLTLDRDGFETRVLFRRRYSSWESVGEFSVVPVPGTWFGKRLAYEDHANAIPGTPPPYSLMVQDGYRVGYRELAMLLNGWRRRALAEKPTL